MDNKVLVVLYVPILEEKYEIFLPINKTINEIINFLGPALSEISVGHYIFKNNERLYNRVNGYEYNINELVKNTNIRNGTELVIM